MYCLWPAALCFPSMDPHWIGAHLLWKGAICTFIHSLHSPTRTEAEEKWLSDRKWRNATFQTATDVTFSAFKMLFLKELHLIYLFIHTRDGWHVGFSKPTETTFLHICTSHLPIIHLEYTVFVKQPRQPDCCDSKLSSDCRCIQKTSCWSYLKQNEIFATDWSL